MSEIEVGEYIRTFSGEIAKITGTGIEYASKVYLTNKYIMSSRDYYVFEDDTAITKHSKNIIDLIEDDDLIEIEYYVRSKGKRIKRLFEVGILEGDKVYFDNVHCSLAYDIQNNIWLNKGFNPKILSILTHEQYELNCYKVGDIE